MNNRHHKHKKIPHEQSAKTEQRKLQEEARYLNIYRIIYKGIFSFLQDKDKLALRLVSPDFNWLVRDRQDETPYKNKIHFVIAVADHFYRDGMLNKYHLTNAWRLYHAVTSSVDLNPAFFYKLCDADQLSHDGIFNQFGDNEDIYATGRIYQPIVRTWNSSNYTIDGAHVWDTNLVWLLSNLHIERSFILCSELSSQNIKRREFPNVYSALAREVGTVIKAGYKISINNNGFVQLSPNQHNSIENTSSILSQNTNTVMEELLVKLDMRDINVTHSGQIKLQPNKDQSIKKLRIADISVSDAEIQSAVDQVNDAKKSHAHAMRVASQFKSLFEYIESLAVEEREIFLEDVLKLADNIFRDLFLFCKNKKIALESFVKAFNNEFYFLTIKLPAINHDFYFEENQIEKIKKIILLLLKKQISTPSNLPQNDPALTTVNFGKIHKT